MQLLTSDSWNGNAALDLDDALERSQDKLTRAQRDLAAMAEEATPRGPPGRGLSRGLTRLLGAKASVTASMAVSKMLTEDETAAPSPPAAAALVVAAENGGNGEPPVLTVKFFLLLATTMLSSMS